MRKLKCRDVEIGFLMSDSFFWIQKLKTFFGEKKISIWFPFEAIFGVVVISSGNTSHWHRGKKELIADDFKQIFRFKHYIKCTRAIAQWIHLCLGGKFSSKIAQIFCILGTFYKTAFLTKIFCCYFFVNFWKNGHLLIPISGRIACKFKFESNFNSALT